MPMLCLALLKFIDFEKQSKVNDKIYKNEAIVEEEDQSQVNDEINSNEVI